MLRVLPTPNGWTPSTACPSGTCRPLGQARPQCVLDPWYRYSSSTGTPHTGWIPGTLVLCHGHPYYGLSL